MHAHHRRQCLACHRVYQILIQELKISAEKYGWSVGRYVVMPDHMHLFCAVTIDSSGKPMELFLGKFKEWSAKRLHREIRIEPPLWQPEFFDHLLRSSESYVEKSQYVWENPVRAGLVQRSEDWPFAGEINDL